MPNYISRAFLATELEDTRAWANQEDAALATSKHTKNDSSHRLGMTQEDCGGHFGGEPSADNIGAHIGYLPLAVCLSSSLLLIIYSLFSPLYFFSFLFHSFLFSLLSSIYSLLSINCLFFSSHYSLLSILFSRFLLLYSLYSLRFSLPPFPKQTVQVL